MRDVLSDEELRNLAKEVMVIVNSKKPDVMEPVTEEKMFDWLKKDQELYQQISKDVGEAIQEVFKDEENNIDVTGWEEEQVNEKTTDYFRRLMEREPDAIAQQYLRIERLSKEDLSWILKEAERQGII